MLVTLEGMTISERELHHKNAPSPMRVTLSGITRLFKEKQPLNALLHIILTPSLIE